MGRCIRGTWWSMVLGSRPTPINHCACRLVGWPNVRGPETEDPGIPRNLETPRIRRSRGAPLTPRLRGLPITQGAPITEGAQKSCDSQQGIGHLARWLPATRPARSPRNPRKKRNPRNLAARRIRQSLESRAPQDPDGSEKFDQRRDAAITTRAANPQVLQEPGAP